MSNVVDIRRRLQQRRTFDYESSHAAGDAARTRIDEMVRMVDGQLVVAVDEIWPALCEVRSILFGDATWPENVHDRTEAQ